MRRFYSARRFCGALTALGMGIAIPLCVQAGTTADTYRQLNIFGDVYELVKSDYVDPEPDNKLVEAAINGMLTALDPHSSYMNAKEFSDMQVETRGEFGGLGIEVTMVGGLVKVVAPYDDTPASKAGIKTGDFIIGINGKSIQGLSLHDAVEKMRGPIGSKITLKIKRPNVAKAFTVSLTRAIIKIKAVQSKRLGNTIYIRITQFNEQVASELKKALTILGKAIGGPSKIKGVILDLRNNPGGLLDQAIAVCDDFLNKGEIVSTRGRKPDDISRYNATPGDMMQGKPIIVLINGGSASASEIVAGALQDHKRALILGSRSFGKGSVQTIIPLPNHGALRLTTARYYTPSGRSIQAKGIEPEVVVKQPVTTANGKSAPTIRSEADLPHHLAPEGRKPDPEADEPRVAGPIPKDPAKDVQLQTALKRLSTIKMVNDSITN